MSQDWRALQQIWSGSDPLIWGTQAHKKNADPLSSHPQSIRQNNNYSNSPVSPQQLGPGGIPENLYYAAVQALYAAGLDPNVMSDQQWQQFYQLVAGTPTLWDFYEGQGIAQSGVGAVNALGQNQWTAFVNMLSSALQGQQDPSSGQALSTFGSQLQGQAKTTAPANLVGTGGDLPNDYVFGNCTYYVASHYQIPGNWGNASSWLSSAQASGFTTSQTPAVGAIVVYGANGGYSQYGHVAIVTAVNPDGTFQVSEMNYNGFDQVDSRTSTMADVSGFIDMGGMTLHGDLSLSATQQTEQLQNTDEQLQQEFPSAVSVFEKYFGRVPTTNELLQTVGAKSATVSTGGQSQGVVSATPQQYAGMIESAAAQYGISALLLSAQIQQESGFNANAQSSAGALGIAQFMPGTAAGLGVNPMDPQSAINGMAKLMSQYFQQFGSWTKALYAYNGGPGSVNSPFGQSLQYVQDIAAIAGGNVDSLAQQAGSGVTGQVQVSGATTDAAQQELNVRAMPSHLAGMNEGQYTDMKTLVDGVSNQLLGHTSTDGIIQTLWNLGKSDPSQLTQAGVTYWYNMQSGTQLATDAATAPIYNQIAQASAPILSAIYGESGNDPGMVSNIYAGTPTAQPGYTTGGNTQTIPSGEGQSPAAVNQAVNNVNSSHYSRGPQ